MPGSGQHCCGDDATPVSGDSEEGDIQEIQITVDEGEESEDEEAQLEPGTCESQEAVLMRNTAQRRALHAAPVDADAEDGEATHLSVSERSRLSENTRLATRYAVRIFREYLSETAQSTNFESMDKPGLCRLLRAFYSEARSKSGQLYSKSSLISIRSSLNRYLNEPPFCRTLDLTKDPELRSANLALAAVIRRLEEQGAGPVVQKQAITRSDLRRLYASAAFSARTPFGLLNKVWFETCMYFCTRGRENQRELEEDSFGLATDEDGRRFVYFKALGPYHKSRSGSWSRRRADTDEENLPRMYETGTGFCPYASFVKYLAKRNPACRAFFQRPRDHCSDNDATWFENKAVGKNLLGTRMQMLSRAAKLSKTYTNHCIGAVSIATLNSVAGIGSKLAPLPLAPEMTNGNQRPRRDTEDAPHLEEAKTCKRARADTYSGRVPLPGPGSPPKRLCVRPGSEGTPPPGPVKPSADCAPPEAPDVPEHQGDPALGLAAQVTPASGLIQHKPGAIRCVFGAQPRRCCGSAASGLGFFGSVMFLSVAC